MHLYLSKISFSCKLKLKLKVRTAISKKIKSAIQLSPKQELELKHLLQQLHESDTVLQNDNITVEKTQIIPLTSKKYHHSKLLDLKFQYLLYSSSMLDRKTKRAFFYERCCKNLH